MFFRAAEDTDGTGLGLYIAERIVTELKNKAPAFAGEAGANIGLKQELGEGVASAPVSDAVSALSNLGYSRDIAANAVAAAILLVTVPGRPYSPAVAAFVRAVRSHAWPS